MIACNDIGTVKRCTIVAFEHSLLLNYFHTKDLELIHNPLFTIIMSLAVHGPWTKVALTLAILIGTISTEHRTNRLQRSRLTRSLLSKISTTSN